MRKLFMFAILSMLLVPFVGCGGQPDPREREDFVDTTDPDAAADMLTDPSTDPKTPAGSP